MGAKLLTPQSEIDKYIANRLKSFEEKIISVLGYVGNECVNIARRKKAGDYTNQTGNLRSSVGYVIAFNGAVVKDSGFDVVKDGEVGSNDGLKFATEIAARYKSPVLIVVAGMNYAAYVAAKGYDVLDSAQLYAEKAVPRIVKQLGLK